MNEIEKAIEILTKTWESLVGNYRYQNGEKIDTEDAYYLAIQALQEKADREKMRCVNCGFYYKGHCSNPNCGELTPRTYTDFCSWFAPNKEKRQSQANEVTP